MATQDEDRFDVLIAGGGVIGLACAWRALQRGLSVCVLERDRAGSGASDVAAGMLAPVGEASWGEEGLIGLNLAAHRLWPEFAAELEAESGVDPGFWQVGALHVALDRDETEELQRRHRLHREHGLDSEWLDAAACRELEPGLAPSVAAGVLAPHEAVADPRSLCAALLAAVAERGGVVDEGSEVASAEFDRGVTVRTSGERELRGGTLLLATGSDAGRTPWLEPAERPPVRPVKGEIVTLRERRRARPEDFAGAGPDRRERVCSRIVVGDRLYIVPRPDGRLLIGATVEELGFDTTVTAGGVHELLREGYRTLPDIAEMELVEVRAGLRPGTPDNSPLIGQGAREGLMIATGHYRNGVLQAPATAAAVAALLVGEEPPFETEPFRPDRHRASMGGDSSRAAAGARGGTR
ncbi:MAG: glycine oxidase ThiO [Actinobacteria bacterium]|nr:glycine oxidase ThiO [Actinomycetota bacterium]